MDEIRALEPNGIKVISTFSGCGGSSLGYRMAGCTVLGASEFVPAAYEVYRLNASPNTVIWTDDIREMNGVDMLRDVGLAVGELDILDGSPPCAAFSTAGKRSDGWGHVKKYSDTSQRVDDLFYEYARVLKEMQPRAFVAENVEGLVKGSAKGYFKRIYAALEGCGYNVRASVLDASWLGVPQRRKRLIFIGIRNDLCRSPMFPTPLPHRYSMRDALPHLDGQVKPGQGDKAWAVEPSWNDSSNPSATIGASEHTGNGRFPVSVIADRDVRLVAKQWSAPIPAMQLELQAPTVTATGMLGVNRTEIAWSSDEMFLKDFGSNTIRTLSTEQPAATAMAYGLGGVAAHQCGFVMVNDLGRLVDPETQSDLLRVSETLQSQYPDKHLRKLSIAELRRICSYPDDFQLQGSYGQRWERLGRSVPPVMMSHIARSVVETLCAD
jgi:DNA (cytosine-5)-methyltransferase 1